MEAFSVPPTVPILALSRTLRPSSSLAPYRLLLLCRQHRPSSRCFSQAPLTRLLGNLLRDVSSRRSAPLACISVAGSGGDGGAGRDSDGGGGDGGGGGEAGTKPVGSGDVEDFSSLGADAIVLDVGGMSCGGCAASVKRILESQPLVSSASVNLATETAIVWAVPEAKVARNWKQQLGEELATHLTTCGFKSNLRGQGQDLEVS